VNPKEWIKKEALEKRPPKALLKGGIPAKKVQIPFKKTLP